MTQSSPVEVTLREAYADECAALTRLFNPPFRPGPDGRWLVALRAGTRPRPVGMAVLAWPAAGAGPGSAQVAWAVLPRYRDSGLVGDLLDAAAAVPRPAHVARLITHHALAAGDPTEAALASRGFAPCEQLDTYEAPFDGVWRRCRRVAERARRQGLIPAGVRVRAVPRERVAELRALFHDQGIVHCLDFDARLSPHHPEPADLGRSAELWLEGARLGALLVCPCRDGPGYLVAGRWVHPAYRNGWANALLLDHAAALGRELDLAFLRFVANRERHSETARFATRMGGAKVASARRWCLDRRA